VVVTLPVVDATTPPVEPAAGTAIAVLSDPVVGIPVVGTPVVGIPVVGTPVVGIPVVGTPVVGTPVVGMSVVGTPVVGTSVVGTPDVGGGGGHDAVTISRAALPGARSYDVMRLGPRFDPATRASTTNKPADPLVHPLSPVMPWTRVAMSDEL
jgi:hypothetical protein